MESPQVDVVEVTPGGEIIEYEIKLPHLGREESARALQGTYIVRARGFMGLLALKFSLS
jgi:hypothetical protein